MRWLLESAQHLHPGRHDPSTEAIKAKLAAPRDPKVTTAHAGVASVSTDGGTKPQAHDCGADCDNADANARFNDAMKPARETTRPDQLVAAGITGNYGR
jgi:hypothetical protein